MLPAWTRKHYCPKNKDIVLCAPVRVGLMVFGWFNIILGIIGRVLPVMPTTVFLLIALWAFSKSSERFQMWAWNHPRFGPTIRAWHEHKVIPVRAKIAALSMMAATAVGLVLMSHGDWHLPAISGGVMVLVALWIVTRPSRVGDVA